MYSTCTFFIEAICICMDSGMSTCIRICQQNMYKCTNTSRRMCCWSKREGWWRFRRQGIGLNGFLSNLMDGAWLVATSCHMMGAPLDSVWEIPCVTLRIYMYILHLQCCSTYILVHLYCFTAVCTQVVSTACMHTIQWFVSVGYKFSLFLWPSKLVTHTCTCAGASAGYVTANSYF